jgi:hypothetical protein
LEWSRKDSIFKFEVEVKGGIALGVCDIHLVWVRPSVLPYFVQEGAVPNAT